jgi:hypothetical protein
MFGGGEANDAPSNDDNPAIRQGITSKKSRTSNKNRVQRQDAKKGFWWWSLGPCHSPRCEGLGVEILVLPFNYRPRDTAAQPPQKTKSLPPRKGKEGF